MTKTILFYVGHPAHYHNIRNLAARLESKGYKALIVARQKDVLFRLLENCPFETILIGAARGTSKLSKAIHLAGREWQMLKIVRRHRPIMMLGTDMIIAHVGRLLGIPAFILNEDDAEAVPLFAKLAYPGATGIFCPAVCSVGKYGRKKIPYPGYHELAYLHPRYFTPDPSKVSRLSQGKPYYLLRFVELTAHHDAGRRGISNDLAREITGMLSAKGNVFISSEKPLDPALEPFRIGIPPADMHHALAFADLFIGDSQTMTAEAAVMGTPALRFNDFVGELSYLEELEHRWHLTYGFRTDNPAGLLERLKVLLGDPGARTTWKRRRDDMLRGSVDLTALWEWFISEYPGSLRVVREEPLYYEKFITT